VTQLNIKYTSSVGCVERWAWWRDLTSRY